MPGSDFDRLNHILGDGVAELGGTLEVILTGGFQPLLGQSFTFLTASGSVEGEFEELSLPEMGGGLFLEVEYAPNSVSLSVQGLLGDYNYDGAVDAADYTVWRDGLGTTFTPSEYDVWASNFGATSPADSATVPEPSVGLLLVAAIYAGWLSRHRSPAR